jgi:hypothetical protein
MTRGKDLDEQFSFDQKDKDTYQLLFENLEDIKKDELPEGFADKVMLKLLKKKDSTEGGFDFVMLGGVVLIIVSIVLGLLFIYGLEGFKDYRNLTSWSVFIGVIVAAIQYFDKKLADQRSNLSH